VASDNSLHGCISYILYCGARWGCGFERANNLLKHLVSSAPNKEGLDKDVQLGVWVDCVQ
jgi:hypothetical protein